MNSRFLKLSLFLLTMVGGFISCKKEDNQNPDPSGNDKYYFTAEIDGADFSGDLNDPATFGAFKYHDGTLSISIPQNVANEEP